MIRFAHTESWVSIKGFAAWLISSLTMGQRVCFRLAPLASILRNHFPAGAQSCLWVIPDHKPVLKMYNKTTMQCSHNISIEDIILLFRCYCYTPRHWAPTPKTRSNKTWTPESLTPENPWTPTFKPNSYMQQPTQQEYASITMTIERIENTLCQGDASYTQGSTIPLQRHILRKQKRPKTSKP